MPSTKTTQLSQSRINQLKGLVQKLGVELWDYSFNLVDQALTHTSARAASNHERLEFIGDAVLRLAATEFINKTFPTMSVGESSALRSQLVSDRWLAEVGEQIQIDQLLIIGAKATADDPARNTIRAETTEALIGALYEGSKSLAPIHHWLTPFWQTTSDEVLSAPHRYQSKNALQEWSQGQGLGCPNYEINQHSKKHGDQKRFFAQVLLNGKLLGEGWGGSIKDAEQAAAKVALQKILPCP
ncbi:Ribonuclease 3 [Prochlorococcus marinus str. MIT 1313]|uniref:ribonuclease III n=1 Tax=Prochlorococcus TaxID=1218 RepID=UPI0007B31D7C|nr:ribonuclease III [Prochlorococcus marinus]KZR68565.1 Ribonuclease 3 [Prochlorococcus marinus str. MIT 1313]KZR71197.1 Ribonuclease 3 [Prochlorococcus marinus str. MIT 1318]